MEKNIFTGKEFFDYILIKEKELRLVEKAWLDSKITLGEDNPTTLSMRYLRKEKKEELDRLLKVSIQVVKEDV